MSKVVFAAVISMAAIQVAPAAPVVIDSEQKALAALLSAHTFIGDSPIEPGSVPQLLTQITFPARDWATQALAMLASRSNYPEFSRLRSGLTVECPLGGTLFARAVPNDPKVIQLRWTDCATDPYPNDTMAPDRQVMNGPGTVGLSDSTFSPGSLELLRLGSATEDVTAYLEYGDEWYGYKDTRSINVTLSGLVPIVRNAIGYYIGDFDHRIHGFWEMRSESTTQIPGIPPDTYTSTSRMEVANGLVKGSLRYDAPWRSRTDDLTLVRGTYKSIWTNYAWPRPGTYSLTANHLRVHSNVEYGPGNGLRTLAIDGRADITWPASAGSGCLNGLYVFRTDALLEHWLAPGLIYRAGSLNVNNAVSFNYSSPYVSSPPPYPGVPTGTVATQFRRAPATSYSYDYRVGLMNVAAQCGL
jgi:hypothetical protein